MFYIWTISESCDSSIYVCCGSIIFHFSCEIIHTTANTLMQYGIQVLVYSTIFCSGIRSRHAYSLFGIQFGLIII